MVLLVLAAAGIDLLSAVQPHSEPEGLLEWMCLQFPQPHIVPRYPLQVYLQVPRSVFLGVEGIPFVLWWSRLKQSSSID